MTPLLEVRGLTTAFPTGRGLLLAANGVDLELADGEALGLVGESGSGKSVTCRSLIGLVPAPGETIAGEVLLGGRDLLRVSKRELRRVRAREVGVVFQDATSALNPVYRVGTQLVEVLTANLGVRRREARGRAVELLRRVGIAAPERRFHAYPHELSGGMRQRVMIALAVAARPRLLIADEPTTALDVTIQAQILALLSELREEHGMAVVLVSHDLGVIAHHCDTVAVMYGGYVVERAPVRDLFARPHHPYTRGLLASAPSLVRGGAAAIAGQPPDLGELPPGCPFAPRCPHVRPECAQVDMTLAAAGPGRATACPFVRAPEPALAGALP
jgi:oligopeptide/dipeptide ABC transporter ATP-binding protein